jgi:hypothetical protein
MKQVWLTNTLKKLGVIKSDFDTIFFQNEFAIIKEKSNLVVLLLLTLLTFLAIGFAWGGLEYIKDKMDDPLNNWENIPYTKDNSDDLERLVKRIGDDPTTRQNYSIESVQNFSTNHMFFKNTYGNNTYAWLRTIDFEESEELKNYILLAENRLEAFAIEERELDSLYNSGRGLVVTSDFITRLGYEKPLHQRKVLVEVLDQGQSYFVYLPVLAILKRIPGPDGMTLDFISSPSLYQRYLQNNKMINDGNTELRLVSDLADQDQIQKALSSQLSSNSLEVTKTNFLLNDTKDHFKYEVRYASGQAIEQKEKVVNNLKQQFRKYDFQLYAEWHSSAYEEHEADEYEYASFIFGSFRDIEKFRDSLETEYPSIKISTVRVQQRKNYHLITSLTASLAILLFVFGLISNLSMVISLLRNHLNDNRKNFGTFKAFGLQDNKIVQMYLTIITLFILILILPAVLVGSFIHILFSPLVFDIPLFNFFNWYVLIAVVLFVAILFFQSKAIIQRILSPTPGQLIHDRKL